MSLAHMFYAKQAFRRAMRWARQWRQQRRHAHPSRLFQLEALEPRVLLSANPATLSTIALTNVADLQPAVVEGAQFPPGAFTATAGSRLHESFTTAGEVDAFYFDATAGQHMALELIAHTSAIQGRVEILDPNGVSIGSVDAGTAGGYVLLQDKVLSQTGRYTVEFESLNGTGTYDGNVFVGTTALPTVAAVTNNWINAAGGNWSTVSNWSRGVAPTSTDVVGITLDGTYTVTMDVSSTVAGLVLGGTTGTQSLTLNSPTFTLNGLSQIGTHGTFNLNGGTLTGTGEIDVSGRLNWNGGTMSGTGLTVLTPGATFGLAPISGAVTLSRVLENQTTATWTSGTLWMTSGTFLNKGTVTASTTGTLTAYGLGGTNQFLNQGAVVKQGTGTVQFAAWTTNVAFNNTGVVDVQGGALDLASGGTHTGDFTVTGATLFTTGTHVFQSTSDVTGTGALRVQGGTASFGGTVQVGAITSNGTTTFGPVLQTSYLAVGAGTTTINTALSLNQLDLGGGTLTGSGNLTVGGAFNLNGGTMSGTGLTLLTAGAAFALAPSSGSVTLGRTLENQTTATWTSGTLWMTSGTFLNKGTVTASTTGTLTAYGLGGTNQFLNQGAVVKQGTGTVQFAAWTTNVAFNNTGVVDVQGGALSLASGGTHSGDFTVSANAVLDLSGAHTFGATSDVTGTTPSSTGIVQVSGGTSTFGGTLTPGTLVLINSGIATVNVTSQVTTLSINSFSTLTGSGTLTATGASTWTGGTMSGTGRTLIGPSGTLALTGATNSMTLSRVLENQGTATWSGGSLFFLGGTFLNKQTFTATSALTVFNGGGINLFQNQGAFIKQGAGTTTTFNAFVPFQNDSTGMVSVQAGTLSLAGGGTHAGDFTVNANAILDLSGTHIFGATSDLTGTTPSITGTVQISGGTSTFGGTLSPGALVITGSGTATVNVASQVTTLSINSFSTLTGSGTLTATGASTWTGGTMSGTGRTLIGPSGTLALTGATNSMTLSRVLENQGTATWSGGSLFFLGGTFLNKQTFTATSALTVFNGGGINLFQNQGAFIKQGAGTTTFNAFVPFQNDSTGTVSVQAGTLNFLSNTLMNFSGTTLTGGTYQISGAGVLQFTGANIVTNAANIILSGTATNPIINESSVNALANFATNAATGSFSLQGGRDFTRTGNFTNNGALSLGAGSIFTVTGGTYTQSATGVLTVQINGLTAATNVGKLAVSGNASLNGTLNIQLTDGYVPVIGDTFQILSFGSLTGDFPNVNGLNFRPGLRFLRDITPTAMTLTVVEDGNFPGPTVTSSSPAEGGIVSPGTLTYQATFSEAMATTNLGPEDVILRDKITNITYTPTTFNFDTLTNRVTVTYANVTESDYEIRLISSDTAFRGNSGGRLDGDGDGREGGDYLVNFTVDNGTRAFDGAFQNAKPLGSLVRESAPVSGRFHAADDFDIYDLVVDAGQIVSLRFTPLDASVRGGVEVLGPDGITSLGSAQALNPNDTVLLQTIPTTATGTYKIKLARLAGAGTYQLVATLNAALEFEQFAGATNNTIATAQDLTSSAIALQGTANRLAVTGKTEAGQPDYYQFDLVAGQAATIELATVNAAALVSSELRDGGDILLATGIKETVNTENQAIRNFVAPATGTYYVRVSGEADRAYTLVVTKSAEFDRESNSTIAAAQDLSVTGQVLGSLGYATETTSAIDNQDHYLIRANAGDVLTITTSTPGGLVNTLNPKIELFTQAGTTVLASDLSSAGDGRNARIADFAISTTGAYRIVVSAESGVGEYTLNVTGATGASVPFTVVSQTVPNGELRTAYPTTFRVDLSEPVLLSSIQASDLQIQRPGAGTPVSADSVTIIDQDTIEFTITTAQTGDGIYTLTISAGAFTSLTNKPLQTTLTSTFDLDATPPRVFNTNLIEGSTMAPDANGNMTVTIQFTEPLTAVGLDAGDVTLRDTITNSTFVPTTFNYSAATNTLTLTYSNVPDSSYALTLLSSATGFRDLRGNLLDGDANGTTGGNWVRNFSVDTATRIYPVTLQPLAPAGSLIYTDNVPASNSGLLSWWQGEDNAADSADGNSGILQGGATFAPGKIGQAFQFDGVDDYVNIPDSTTLDSLSTAATVSMWIKPDGPGYIFSRRDPLLKEQISLFFDGVNLGFVVGTTTAVSVYYTAPGVVTTGAFYHVAATVNAITGITKLYVNGVDLPLSTTFGPSILSGTLANVNNLFLGRRQTSATSEGVGGAAHYKGLIDDVRLYNRALSGSEIAAQAGRLPVAGRFNSAGDVDAYTLNLDAGQKLSVTLKPGDTSIQGVINILDPNGALIGAVTAGSVGATTFLQNVPVALSGVHTVQVSSQVGTGAYSLSTTLNATVEAESLGGSTNNDLASAVDLTPSSVTLQGSAVRYAVTGQTESATPDVYRFDLSAGQAATLVLTSTDGTGLSNTLDLLDATGVVLASGLQDGMNVDRAIRNFVAPAAGTYFIRINAGPSKPYSLVVTRQTDFEREPDGVNTTAQNISVTGQALGALESRASVVGTTAKTGDGNIRVAVVGTSGGDNAGFIATVNQLNNDTFFDFTASLVTASQVDTVAELQAYDTIVIGDNFLNQNQLDLMATALRTWVEAGGGVVAVGGTIYAAGSATPPALANIDAIVPMNTSGGYSYYYAVTPLIPNSTVHPVTAGVTSFTPSTFIEVATTSVVDAGATVLATVDNQPTVVVGTPGKGRSVYVGPFYALYASNPNYNSADLRSGSADRLLEQAVAWAGARDQVDQYLVQASTGELRITTTTPGGDTGEPSNTLVPKLELFNSSGLLVASNQNGAADGRNAQIVYQVPTGSAGTYRVVVTAVSGIGEYTLAATGTAVVSQNAAPTVVATTPVSGARFATPPTTIDLTFSEGMRIDSISASDLQVSGGGTVTGLQVLDGKTFRFTVSIPNVPNVDTTYTMTLAPGAVSDLQGNTNALFISTFVVDHVGPRIVAQTPAVQASSPWNALTVTFSEPINAASFTAADVVLVGPGGNIAITSITGAGTTFTLNFAAQTTAGAYTVTIGPNITDTVGNLMDQNNNGINGEVGTADAYTATVALQAPNLRVQSVTTDPVSAAEFGQPVTVTWTVENAGADPAREAWSDKIWLSTNQTLETATDIALSSLIASGLTGPLNAGGTYTKNATVTLPLTTSLAPGAYFILVQTDAGSAQLETNEADNVTASASLTLTVPLLPDLVVTNISGPATARPGEQVAISWTVTNNGGAAATGTWNDFVFLSSDNAIGGDRFVASFAFTGTIAAGQSIVRTQNLTMPTDVSGTQRLVVQTDASGQIYEHSLENNNTTIDDQVITMIAPDFQVSNIQLPALSFSGQPVTVTWTLTNNGTADFTGTFSDRLSLSSDATIGSDTFIADVPFTGTLAINQSIQRSHTFTLDRNLSGNRWAAVFTDISGNVLEFPNEGNNAAISAQPTNITLQFSDLVVEAVSAPATAQSSDPIQVTWRVRNQGTLPTDVGSWTDRIVLSTDTVIGAGDVTLANVTHNGALAIDATYTGQFTATLPQGISGDYYILVQTDVNGQVFESSVEGNNVGQTLTPMAVTVKPYPDFQVTTVTGPTDAQPGQVVTLSWTVTNNGTGPSAPPHVDYMYLSTDGTLNGATFLGSATVSVGTTVGGTYSASTNVAIPQFFADGTYRFVVQVDGNNTFYEGPNGGDANNLGQSAPVQITHPDLRVSITNAPSTATSGATVGIDWTVTNNGTGAVQGNWVDRVYLSTNNTFDGTDTLLAEIARTGPLANGANYIAHRDVVIPIDKSGPFFLLVVTDAASQVFETTAGNAEGNNTASSALNIALAPYADLEVSNVTVDNQVVGDPGIVTVGWTVSNAPTGTGTGLTATWTDTIYASTDTVLGNFDDRVLATFTHAGLLNVGDSYAQLQTFYLPIAFQGRYHILVKTDSAGVVFENAGETNNVAEAGNLLDAMPILYADLQVDAITVPATAQTGSSMQVSWTVSNHGPDITNLGSWSDRVYLTSDALGQNIIHDYGFFQHAGQLQPNGAYDRSTSLVIPNTLSGPVYVGVHTAYQSGVFEFLSNNNNKQVSNTPVNVSLSPTPDLKVTTIQGPTTVFEGSNIDLTWTVLNDGTANATGTWSDRVVLKKVGDPSGIGTIIVGTFVYDRGLAVGQTYTRTEQFTFPPHIQGQYQVEVVTDFNDTIFERNVGAGTGETNNTTLDPDFLTVQLRPRPDLQVSNVVSPARVPAGSSVSLEFTVINQGTAATPSLWKDSAYLSLDNKITPDDILIGQFDNVAALDPGQAYTRTTGSVQVPIRFRGEVFLLVKPDASEQVDEFPNDGNNLFAQPLFVEPLPQADLYTFNVVAPDQVLPGTQIEVRYRVENRGSGVTDKTTWTDSVWLTVDKTRPHAGKGDFLLGQVTHQGALPVGDFYEQVVTVTIPDAAKLKPGINTYYITPWSDTYDVVLEDTLAININPDDPNQIDNNNYKARPVIVIGSQPPPASPLGDLTVTNVTPVTPIAEAKPFTVRWTVQNLGPGVIAPGWFDDIILSTTPNLVGGEQWSLGRVTHSSGLAAGELATFEQTYQLSPQTTGTYVVVRTAQFAQEISATNNIASAPVTPRINAPDLRITSVTVPASADSGEQVRVQWTVENIGTAPVWSGTQYWTDSIYFSSDPVYIPGRATKVGELVHSNAQPLAAGAQYTAAVDVTLPAGIEGPYFIHVITDAIGFGAAPDTNPGSNDGSSFYYRTSVYEAGSTANNLRTASLPVLYKESDLRATAVVVPPSVSSGQPLTVTWTVANEGTRNTREVVWKDRVYLSLDPSLDQQDRILGEFIHTGLLAQGASYSNTKTVGLPIGLAGNFYLLVFPDTTDVFGTNDAVHEYRGEGNNVMAVSLPITLTTPPDLQVTQVTIPERITVGQGFTVNYTVANQGGLGTPASQGQWSDLIYLSRDAFFDPQADRFVSSIERTGGLAAGQSYSVSKTIIAPGDLTGAYYVFVVTDPRSATGTSKVFEGSNEQNNDRASAQPLLIEQPPPADLEVQSITAGGTLKVGDPINVSWTVVNNGPNVASGTWSDSVYLSTDETWDINDRLLGQRLFSGPLALNGTYSLSLDSIVPAVAAGQYRVIVRTDIRNQVFEGPNEANNRRFSSDVVNVTVDSIQLGVPFSTTLSTGQERLYKVTVLEGETLRVRLTTPFTGAANEIYLRFNQAPTRFQFDAGPNAQLQSNPAAIVPATRPGDYYILLYGQSEPGANTPVTVLADSLPFGITDVAADQGGDGKYVTFTVNGAKFSPDAVVKLVRPDIAEFVPVNVNVVDSTKILATFDFTDAPHGLYDVKVINPDGATAILPYRYLIERFIEPDVTIGIGGPRVIAAGDTGTYGIALQSLTNLDTPYVNFQFGVSEMGRNNVIYNLPFVQTFNNLRGAPDGAREDVAWASLESDINAAGPLTGYNASTGYLFDLAAGGFTGLTFNVTTYAGLQELVDHSWEALKEKIYNIDPSLRESGVLDNGPEGLDQIFPGLFDIYSRVADPVGECKAWAIPFRFNIFASATALTRDEFIAQQTAEALRLRDRILADTTANATLQTLAADPDTWTTAYLAALEEGGLLRPVDAIPPVRQDPKIVSLLGVFATGVLVGPAGDQFQTSTSLLQFFDKIHSWYGDRDEFVPWPMEERLPPPHCPESSALIPITSVPDFDDVDLGMSQRTHFEAFDIFVPWVGFDQRGAVGTVALPDFASTDAGTLSALDFSQFYADAAAGGQLVAIQGPQGFGIDQFLPVGQALPYQIRFENPSTAPTRPGEIRIVAQLDADLEARSVRLGDLKLGDIQVHIPSDRATFQGDFDFSQSKGYILRVSAGVDVEANTATWLLQAIDPDTGEVIEDTTKGLLAQNNAQGAGLGSVSYTVLPQDGLATGAEITAQARVLFNTAPPADAAIVTQKIDGRAPVTTLTVTKLGNSDDYQIAWTATDDAGGSGVRHTTVYVAEDGGDFLIWQQRTTEPSGIYQGLAGHTYEFFAVSTDNAGNRELPPIGLNGPDDGTTTNLGSVPSGDTTPTDLPPPPAPTPSTNPLFVQAQAQIPGNESVTRPSDFTSVINPFTVQSFATNFQQSHGGIGPLAILPLVDGSVLVSGGLNRGQLFKFSANGGQAITPLATLDVPIYDLAMDAQGQLWASSGGGQLLLLNSTTGEIIQRFGDGITQAIAVHPTTGKIYVSSGDGIEIFDPVTLRFSHFTNYRVDDLAFSPTGELWGTSWPKRGDVVKFANNGKATVMVRLDSQVDSIAFGQAGTPLQNLLFVSSNGGQEGKPSELVMVDIVSLQTAVIARGGPRAETVATTADGKLFIAQADQIDLLNAVLPPVVIATTPVNQGFAPLPIGVVTVRFDQDMLVDASTNSVLNPANFQLTGQAAGAVTIKAVQYDAATRTARLDIDALQTDTYSLTVATTVKSAAGLSLLSPFTVSFTTVSDFSTKVQLDFLNVRSDRANATISYDVRVTNTTANDLLVPVRLVLDPSQYFQGAPIGATFSNGLWLLDLSAAVAGGILRPGESTVVQTVTIGNPFAQRADFGHGIYAIAPANIVPIITSTPTTTATAGTAYSYQVVANDPDGTTLNYFLASAPDGMTISTTGLVSWTPTITSPEQASVVVQVYDSRGAFKAQAYSIAVTGVNAAPVVLPVAKEYRIKEGDLFELGLVAADPDADPLVFYADNLPPGASFDAARGVISWKAGSQSAGTYKDVVLAVTDGLHTVSRSFTILVAPVNDAPSLAKPADRTVREGEPIRIQLSAIDPDASSLSPLASGLRYFSDFLPGGATIDPATGVFEWTPGFTQAGTYNIPFSVSDGTNVTTQRTTITVTNANAAPVFDLFGTLEILENQTLFVRTFAFDPDNPGFVPQDRLFDGTLTPLLETDPTVTYTITGLPTGATFDPVSAQLEWKPTFTQAGTYSVTVTATDNGDGTGINKTSSVTIPITVVNVNRQPVLPDIPNQVVNRGATLDLPVQATDADGNPLTLIAVSGEGTLVPEEAPLPRFATFQDLGNGQGTFHFAPVFGDRGNYTITLYAVDNGDGGGAATVLRSVETFVVQVDSPSEPPVLQHIGNKVAVIGQPLQFTVRATDLDQDPLTFSATPLPPGMTITPGLTYGTAVVSWTPTSEQIGTFTVTIRATDNGNNGAGAIAFDEKTITVVSRVANQAPVLQPIGNKTATETQLFELQLLATDADGDQLTFSGANLPTGSTLDPVTGLFRWTPNFNQSGAYDNISFTVSDGNRSITETISITVVNTNRAPVVIPMIPQSGREDAILNFTIAAADLDNDSLVLTSLTALPAGAHFDSRTGEFEWKPDFTQAGLYSFTIQAQDPSGATGTTNISVRIDNVNRTPILNLTNHQVLVGQQAIFSLVGSDPDNAPLTTQNLVYSVEGLPEGATLNATTGEFRWTPGVGQVGDYLMLVTISDGLATTTDSFVLRAATELQKPHVQIELTPSFPVVPGQKVLADVLATSIAQIVGTTITVNGQPVTFDNLGRAVITAGGPGQMLIRATATDADGQTAFVEHVLKVRNPDDTTAPIMAFDGAVNGMVIRSASAIRATILDSDLDQWTLEIAHANSDTFVPLAIGHTPLAPTGTLSTIDPAGLANGFYRLRLTALDVAGRRAVTEAIVEINSASKTQQFTRTETDLSVTLDGHVFTLVRQYDSLNSALSTPALSGVEGSFGNGWRLANRDVNLETDASRFTNDASLPAFRVGTRLYLTLPTGERVGYTFAPTQQTVNGVTFYTPAFVADNPAIGYQLSAISSKLTRAGDRFFDFQTGEAYNPTNPILADAQFTLTAPDGTIYKIHAVNGITEQQFTDGKKFILSDSGITAVGTGEAVQFIWDASSDTSSPHYS